MFSHVSWYLFSVQRFLPLQLGGDYRLSLSFSQNLPTWLLADQCFIKPIHVTNLYRVQEHYPTAEPTPTSSCCEHACTCTHSDTVRTNMKNVMLLLGMGWVSGGFTSDPTTSAKGGTDSQNSCLCPSSSTLVTLTLPQSPFKKSIDAQKVTVMRILRL